MHCGVGLCAVSQIIMVVEYACLANLKCREPTGVKEKKDSDGVAAAVN